MEGNRDYEEILTAIGRFGTYHRVVIVALTIPIAILCGMLFLCNALLSDGIPDHYCSVSDDVTDSIKQICNQTSSLYSECLQQTCSSDAEQIATQSQCEIKFSNNTHSNTTSPCDELPIIKCTSWTYNGSAFHSSVATEFDLVCENSWKSQMASMALMGGILIGSAVFGQVGDRLGRRPAVISAAFTVTISEFMSTFVKNFTLYCFLQFLSGAGFIGCATIGYIAVTEAVSVKHLVIVAQLTQTTLSVSIMLLAIFGYLVPDWRVVGRATSGVTIPFLVAYIIYAVESPRWLYAEGKVEKGDKAIKQMARLNSSQNKWEAYLQEHELTSFENTRMIGEKPIAKQQSSLGITDLFKHTTMLKFTCVLSYNWFVSTCLYYGLSFSAGLLGGNVFLNIFFTGLVEVPGYALSAFAMEKWGRRPACSSMHILSAIALICMIFAQNSHTASLILFLLGKLGCSGAFGAIYLYTAELYPTSIRGIGIGFCSAISRFGGLAAIAIIMLAGKSPFLSYMIFGAMAFIAGILVCCLPETKQKGYPDTIEECKTMNEQGKLSISACC